MNGSVFWRALMIQAAAVIALSLLLIALPLPESFFRDYGFLAGPGAWALCAVVTARVLALPVLWVLGAALAGRPGGHAAQPAGRPLAGRGGRAAGLCARLRRDTPRETRTPPTRLKTSRANRYTMGAGWLDSRSARTARSTRPGST